MIQDAGEKLIMALHKHADKVNYLCGAENISPNVCVHEIRKSFKRMRAFLKFYPKSPDSILREFKPAIVSLGKSLSIIRESAVNIQVFDKISDGNELISERRIKLIKTHLVQKNSELLKNGFLENQVCSDIHSLMSTISGKLTDPETEHPTAQHVYQGICDSYRKGYDSFSTVIDEYDSEELHKLRKKLKVLWYQLELFKYLQPRYLRVKSDQLHKITEQLGEDHDLYVFLQDIKTGDLELDPGEMEIIENQVQHHKELNGLRLANRLKQFFVDEPGDFNKKMAEVFEV